ncbi:Hypothetical protein CINCED_3A010451 [Cinara cedri]|uniref:Uncharacterized protein n=1 Tax=Cinara cedri TaxID=506608 RepID=A0A5E4NCS2_9HEMI|nr:Hypothetical protein CINCED_3A010451 [Cinara cedri]
MRPSTLFAGLIVGFVVAATAASVNDDEGISAAVPWNNRFDERIYADAPNYLTYQLNHKRYYSVPYHPVARLRSSQNAGVPIPYAIRNNMNEDENRFEPPVWKPTAAELLALLMNRKKGGDPDLENTNIMRFGISKRTRFDGDNYFY